MKKTGHPQYGPTQIRCACGSVVETRSTRVGTIQVEVCSSCHPFFTGQQKFLDAAGRIDRFSKKFGDKIVGSKAKPKKVAPEPKKVLTPKEIAKSLKDLKAAKENLAKTN